ncbi:hypothetical protein GGF50DRAFT_119977 [Schizophyllum commune]
MFFLCRRPRSPSADDCGIPHVDDRSLHRLRLSADPDIPPSLPTPASLPLLSTGPSRSSRRAPPSPLDRPLPLLSTGPSLSSRQAPPTPLDGPLPLLSTGPSLSSRQAPPPSATRTIYLTNGSGPIYLKNGSGPISSSA